MRNFRRTGPQNGTGPRANTEGCRKKLKDLKKEAEDWNILAKTAGMSLTREQAVSDALMKYKEADAYRGMTGGFAAARSVARSAEKSEAAAGIIAKAIKSVEEAARAGAKAGKRQVNRIHPKAARELAHMGRGAIAGAGAGATVNTAIGDRTPGGMLTSVERGAVAGAMGAAGSRLLTKLVTGHVPLSNPERISYAIGALNGVLSQR